MKTKKIIGWTGFTLFSLFICIISSCKKEVNQTTTYTYNTTVTDNSKTTGPSGGGVFLIDSLGIHITDRYIRTSTKQANEADTLFVMDFQKNGSNIHVTTLSCPITCAQKDTVTAPSFNHTMRYYPLIVNGGYTITGTILKLSFTEWNTTTNQLSATITNAEYTRH